jgi:hypothetical protein
MSELNLRFLPWLRRGLARLVQANTTDASATVNFSLKVGGEPVTQSLRMRGPADVIGVDTAQIIRLEPQPGTTDFEPNYFPCIEFATPDLPWMFTPTAPDEDDHLLPWLTLITVSDQLAIIETRANAPLPVLTVPMSELPPKLSEMWAWAHVQTTSLYTGGALTQALEDEPGAFISRILSPRNLKPNSGYIACLVPTFKAGALAGLGYPIAEDTGQSLAWDEAETAGEIELPVYYSWSFHTGQSGDFQTLVMRLQPQELDETVGRRDMDITDIGIPMKGTPGTTYFFGALVSPDAIPPESFHQPPPPPVGGPVFDLPGNLPQPDTVDPIRETIYEFLRAETGDLDTDPYDYRTDDPVVTPPIYAHEQLKGAALPPPAPYKPILPEPYKPFWYGSVNNHPRTRGAAGLGVRIVRKHQEDFMARAWEGVTALRSINQTLQQATLASLTAGRWQSRLQKLEPGEILNLTRSAHARILPAASGQTIWGQLRFAAVPDGSVSADFQRLIRTGGVVHHALSLATGSTQVIQHSIRQLIIENGPHLTSLSMHKLPAGAQLSGIEQAEIDDDSTFDWYAGPIENELGQVAISLDRVLADGIQTTERASVTSAVLTIARLADGHIAYLDSLAQKGYRLSSQTQAAQSAASRLASLSNQYIHNVAAGRTPTVAQIKAIRVQVDTLKSAFGQWSGVPGIVIKPTAPVTSPGLESIAASVGGALSASETISAHLQTRISLDGADWGSRLIPSRMTAAPLFGEAVYPYVCELSPEYMLPGVGDIPQNTVGIVEVNGEFLESVLIGMNHEMSREMRWREYPANLSGTWFKRFWSGSQDDILSINTWPEENGLGENLIGVLKDNSLVLLVKGEVLRRYPNLAVYAVKAIVTGKAPKRVRDVKEPEEQHYPVFSGELANGVKFFGFDQLSYDDVLGTATPKNVSTDGGYFFALQEQPTEPRFGLNEYEPGQDYRIKNLNNWSELSWGHFMPGSNPDRPAYVPVTGKIAVGKLLPDTAEATRPKSAWGSHAAAMARITLQRPIRMLVHASAMLP